MKDAWPSVPLSEILDNRTDVPKSSDIANGNIKIVSKIGFKEGVIKLRSKKETKTKMISVHPGDLLISGINATKGAVAIYDGSDPIAATIHYSSYYPKDEKVDIQFLWFLLRSKLFKKILESHLPGGIKTELKAKRFLNIPIPLPSIKEQKIILNQINHAKNTLKKITDNHESLTKNIDLVLPSKLHQLFGDPYNGILPSIKVDRYEKMSSIVNDVADGPHKTPKYVESGIPFITVLNISSGKLDFSKLKYITKEAHIQYQKRAKAEKGDVLISKDGTIGIPCYIDIDREFSYFVSVALVKPKSKIIHGKYLELVLQTPYLKKRMLERSRGEMIRHLVLGEIKNLLVPIIPLKQQKKIIDDFYDLQLKIIPLKQSHELIKENLDLFIDSFLLQIFSKKYNL
jgi:type I restriction enzyme, S subunit